MDGKDDAVLLLCCYFLLVFSFLTFFFSCFFLIIVVSFYSFRTNFSLTFSSSASIKTDFVDGYRL